MTLNVRFTAVSFLTLSLINNDEDIVVFYFWNRDQFCQLPSQSLIFKPASFSIVKLKFKMFNFQMEKQGYLYNF